MRALTRLLGARSCAGVSESPDVRDLFGMNLHAAQDTEVGPQRRYATGDDDVGGDRVGAVKVTGPPLGAGSSRWLGTTHVGAEALPGLTKPFIYSRCMAAHAPNRVPLGGDRVRKLRLQCAGRGWGWSKVSC